MEAGKKRELLKQIRSLRDRVEAQARAAREMVEVLEGALFEMTDEAQTPIDAAPPEPPRFGELLTAQEAQERLKISASTFYDWIRNGRLPEGRAYGPRSRRWKMSELEQAVR